VQILCLDAANGDEGVLESGREQVKFTIALREVSRADTAWAGARAATLGELSQAGFPVPDGFVVTTAAFERFLAHNGLRSGHTATQVEASVLPKDVADAIVLAAVPSTTEGAPMAVRSSSVAEDLAAASYTGQYETVLGVNAVADMREAVRRCWISASSPRIASYSATRTGGPAWHTPNAMAVLVQRHIEAGVIFTTEPITGNGRDTLISAVRGLGDRLVSGQDAAGERVVREQSAPERALTAAQVLEVAALARCVERSLQCP
jgi:rifampicin phosphotransferase